MSGTTQASVSPFAIRTVAILIAVAVFSFGAIMVLAGWAPELRDRDRAAITLFHISHRLQWLRPIAGSTRLSG